MYYHTENAAVVPKLKIRQKNQTNRSVNCVSVLFLCSSRWTLCLANLNNLHLINEKEY